MSRKRVQMAYIIIYAGAIGMIALYLIDVVGIWGDNAGVICWVLFILCFIAAMFGVHSLRNYSKCPYCKGWNRHIPSPWKANDVKYCSHCRKPLEYDK